MWVLHWLPLPVLARLGEALGTVLFWVMRPRRDITLTNLRLCFPNLSDAERAMLAKEHFQAYARSVLERGILWWGSEDRLRKLIVIEPEVPLQKIRSSPTILLCPHFVCLDVAGAVVALHSGGCSIYAPQKNPIFDAALRRGRARFKPVHLFTRMEGIRQIVRLMRNGVPYFMLPDMDFGIKDAEFVTFFGTPAATLIAPARLAAMGAKVIPVVATYLPGYRGWKVKFYPEWQDFPGSDIVAATRRMNAFIEERVAEAPAEYLWTHRRFKTRPAGAPSVYQSTIPIRAQSQPKPE